jgi:hypothetical protein
MNDEARRGVKGAGNLVLIRASPRIWPRESWAAKLYVYAASSSIRHSTFVIRHFEPRCK